MHLQTYEQSVGVLIPTMEMDTGGKVILPLVLSMGLFVLWEEACAIISLLIVI